jgi:hypothetical protein
MFKILVCEVYTWLVATLGKTTIASTVREYLLEWGQVTMESCIHGNNKNVAIVSKLSDHLGWGSFLEGRILEHWLCRRPIILCTVQGYFWHTRPRSDAIRVMRPDR